MEFVKHLFISYAHTDNEPDLPGEKGWVELFHMVLQSMLNKRLKGRAEIWRDTQLQGNDRFKQEIYKQFPQTAIMLSLISPSYLDSKWCRDEVNEFVKAAEKTGGITINEKARILRVEILPPDKETDYDVLPSIVHEQIGYPFYNQ